MTGWHQQADGRWLYWDGRQWHDRPPKAWTFNMGFMILGAVSAFWTILLTFLLVAGGLSEEGNEASIGMGAMWFLWGAFWTVLWFAFGSHRTRGDR